MEQKIITSQNNYIELAGWLTEHNCKKVLVVCDNSITFMDDLNAFFDKYAYKKVQFERFSDFQPNPLYESVVKGVKEYRAKGCDAIMAVGGGSAMDVAKCIKLYCNMDGDGENGSYMAQEIIPNHIPFLAVPTTAGTGSEATRYAVIYYQDVKQSITSDSFIPETVLMDSNALKTLPLYQRKSTMMDAFCHAIESFWSVNSNEISKEYSREAIRMILRHMDGYLCNQMEDNDGMLKAAHLAGKAINITQTTAGHAMCYKVTSLFHCAHGHAAILCNRVLFPWMIKNTSRCTDPRGESYLKTVFNEIADAMGCNDVDEATAKLNRLFERLELEIPTASEAQFEILKNSVNPVRLKNHPIALDIDTIDVLYHSILNEEYNESRKTC